MKLPILSSLILSVLWSTAQAQVVHPDIVITVDVVGANPGSGWFDSYSVGDQCYCASVNYDHGIGTYPVETPLGWMTVEQACNLIGPGPGSSGRPVRHTL